MRFNLLSSFAAGILITTFICGIVYFSGKSDVSKTSVKTTENQANSTVQLSEKEMKNKLAAAGYIVQTKAEYNKNIKNAKGSVPKEAPSKDNNSNKVVYRVVVNVADGMTSIDVGNILVKAKIIPNAFKFSQDIEKKGLEKNLRPGTFEVDSAMAYDQIIATIFKK